MWSLSRNLRLTGEFDLWWSGVSQRVDGSKVVRPRLANAVEE
jgi:hypothetical protein